MSEMFLVSGEASGASEGVFSLTAQFFYTPPSFIRIPKGCRLKVWMRQISGNSVRIALEMTHDCTVASPTYVTLEEDYLVSDGTLEIERRKPTMIDGVTGKEAIRFSWSDLPTDARARFVANIEVVEIKGDYP